MEAGEADGVEIEMGVCWNCNGLSLDSFLTIEYQKVSCDGEGKSRRDCDGEDGRQSEQDPGHTKRLTGYTSAFEE